MTTPPAPLETFDTLGCLSRSRPLPGDVVGRLLSRHSGIGSKPYGTPVGRVGHPTPAIAQEAPPCCERATGKVQSTTAHLEPMEMRDRPRYVARPQNRPHGAERNLPVPLMQISRVLPILGALASTAGLRTAGYAATETQQRSVSRARRSGRRGCCARCGADAVLSGQAGLRRYRVGPVADHAARVPELPPAGEGVEEPSPLRPRLAGPGLRPTSRLALRSPRHPA